MMIAHSTVPNHAAREDSECRVQDFRERREHEPYSQRVRVLAGEAHVLILARNALLPEHILAFKDD